ncbi:MAG: hypothetical protein ACTSQI_11690 [Candidatus Helarchaeota archaeon]
MSKYLAWLIAGGVLMNEGGSFLIIGLMYPYIIPQMAKIWNVMLWIGVVSLILGGMLLIIGLYKRAHRFDGLQ